MRVTNQMVTDRYINDLQTSKENLSKVQSQMTSEKEINKPSDDPAKIVKVMQMNSDINTNKQYATNIDDATTYLDTSDTVLNSTTTLLQRVRDILVSSGGTNTDNTANKDEVNQKIAQLGQYINTKSGGKYIFGGENGDSKPIDVVEAKAATIDPTDPTVEIAASDATIAENNSDYGVNLSAKVSSGYSIKYGITAGDILNFKDSVSTTDATGTTTNAILNLKDILNNIVNHMNGKNSAGVTDSTAAAELTGTDLTNITDAITNITNVRSKEGTTVNTLADIKGKNTSDSANLTDMLSKTQDIDIAEKTMEYANMQNVYTAALQISSKIIQPSLMDYLK